jgi:hypothetical protein
VISRRQRARKRGHAEIAESKREREEGRMSEEGLNPVRKSSRTERSPRRSEEGNQSKEIGEKIETVLREIREDSRGEQSTKKGISGSLREKGRARKRGHDEIVRSKERKQQERKRRG